MGSSSSSSSSDDGCDAEIETDDEGFSETIAGRLALDSFGEFGKDR